MSVGAACRCSPARLPWRASASPHFSQAYRLQAAAQPVGEQRDHTLRMAVVAGGYAHARDRTQDIVGIDIGAYLAGGCCRFQQRAQDWAQALLEIHAYEVERQISRVQRRGKPAFGRDECRLPLHPSRQCLERRALGRHD